MLGSTGPGVVPQSVPIGTELLVVALENGTAKVPCRGELLLLDADGPLAVFWRIQVQILVLHLAVADGWKGAKIDSHMGKR